MNIIYSPIFPRICRKPRVKVFLTRKIDKNAKIPKQNGDCTRKSDILQVCCWIEQLWPTPVLHLRANHQELQAQLMLY